jgi:Na+-driven multidrug efflux pump
MFRIVKIGLPGLVAMVQQNVYQLVLVRLMAPYGTVAVGAHGLLQRVEGLFIMPAMAVGMGSGVLVGQNLGARQPERATKTVWISLVLLEGLIVLASLAIYIWPGAVVRIFNSEPEMVATAGSYLRVAVAGFVAVGFWMVFMQSLNGAGDTTATMIMSLASVWLVGLSIAIVLPRIGDIGVYGIRWGIAAAIICNGVTQTLYFCTGRWKRKKV